MTKVECCIEYSGSVRVGTPTAMWRQDRVMQMAAGSHCHPQQTRCARHMASLFKNRVAWG